MIKKINLIYLLPTLYYVGICYLSSRTADEINSFSFLNFPYSDKVIHFLVFGFLSSLIAFCLYLRPIAFFESKKGLMVLFLILFSLAALDEYHQSYVPGRQQDFNDWLADCLGMVFCFFLTKFFLKQKLSKDVL